MSEFHETLFNKCLVGGMPTPLKNISQYSIYSVYLYIYIYWLVVSTPLKNMTVSWDYYSPYMEK